MTEDNKVQGQVFDIQRYSIHDGPGIRTTVFFKGCPLRCFWCQNPESQMLAPQILLYREKCKLCGRCLEVCPTGASWLSTTSSEIDRDKCIGCGKCAEGCPNQARNLVGTTTTVDGVLREVLKDVRYYANSGGGVTLSGGEPLFQPEFALGILERCKHAGLHTCVETCGYAPWSAIERILGQADLVLFDIKHVDTRKHKAGTGLPNELILENARGVARYKSIKVRVPLIPGYNDSYEDIRAIARFVKAELNSVDVDLLAYNKMGESKYARLDKEPVRLDLQEETHIQALRDVVSQELKKGTVDPAV